MMVLGARFDDRLTFAGLLAQTKESAVRTYEHQLLPAERLVRELRDRRPSEGLFDVMFVLQDTRVPTLSLRDARVEPLAAEIGSAKFDLTAAVSESDTGLRVALQYRRDLFDPSPTQPLLSHLDTP